MDSNLSLMKKRLLYQGGDQEHRMIKDKYNTFIKTLAYSYQGCDVKKLGETVSHRALINPDKNKTDYDDKILSIDYAFGFQAGDIFEWVGTNTYWLIYLQELTEDAYFRSEIRRCKYKIKWIEDGSIKSTWAYVRGPVETKINVIQKNGISVDVPNWSLNIYMPANEETLNKFKRYDRFMLNGTTWEVQVVDSLSQVGILEVVALEYFTNTTLDEKEENLTDAFSVIPVAENEEGQVVPVKDLVSDIKGKTFIKPLADEVYKCGEPDSEIGAWSIKEAKRPVTLTPANDGSVKLRWTMMTSGQFTLVYSLNNTSVEKLIVVESLF